MKRMVHYVKDRTEAFDGPFPARKGRLSSRSAFERVLNWLSAFIFMQDFAFENGAWGGLRSSGWRRCPRG